MNRTWWKVLTGLLIMLFSSGVVQAQTFPLPASSSAAPAICAGCRGSNWFGVPNDGLPTFPYSSPIKAHTGRYVDSINTKDYQVSRTARAARIRPCAGQNRMYVQLGATLAAYKLDTFFTQKLPAGGIPVDIMSTGLPYYREGFPLEVVTPPDAFVYPEATNQGWEYANVDGQERLYDFDCDDRGYVYAAYSILGWGIVQDDGRTGAKALPLVWQVLGASTKHPEYGNLNLISPTTILSLKVGSKYYAIVSSQSKSSKAEVWDVTTPKNLIAPVAVLNDNQLGKGIKQWAKNGDGTRFAYIDGSLRLQIYDGASFVGGGNALHTEANRSFVAVGSDGTNFWAVDSNGNLSGNKLWRFSPAGSTYAAVSFDLGTLSPQVMGVGGGYLAIAGFAPGINIGTANDVVLYKIDGAQPEKIDLKNFFRNYYGSPPTAAYARPGEYASTLRGIQPVKQNGRLFLMYSMHGLGDVYEIQAGDSVTGSYTQNSYGTANPNNPTRLTALGPFPGDPITFTSATTSAFALNVNWTFDNPELGASDVAVPKRTGDPITYQWSGLATTTQITRPRTVTVKGNSDPTMSDALTITHAVPNVRVGVAASPPTLITGATTGAPQLLVGDSFTDASEGSIEGHFSNFTISPDGVNVNKKPNGTVPVGQCGDHVLSFNAHYGPYNEATFVPANASHYVGTIANVSYGVRPFTIALGGSTISGAGVIFNGSGRTSIDPSAFAATPPSQWTVTWTLKNASGSDIGAPQPPSTVAIGTVPTFTVANRSLIVAGSVLTLRGEVPTASLSTGCASRNVVTASTQFELPVAQINRNGCDNVGSPCTFTATSGNGDTSGWLFAWRLRNTGTNTVVATGAANPFTPNIAAAGTYKAELDVTKTIFTVSTETTSFPVAAAQCGILPTGRNMGIQYYCPAAGCLPGQSINFIASPLGYTIQACDNISWSFGDSAGTASGPDVNHTYGNSGTYTVTMTFTNASNSTPASFTKTVTIGTVAPTCNAPQPGTFTFSGSKGCSPTKACTTTETITFFPSANLQSCDSLRWNFDGVTSTETFPQKLYSTPGNRTVSLTVRNQNGESSPYTLTVQVVADDTAGGCTIAPKANGISILFTGPQTNCSRANPNCSKNEVIAFDAAASFSYTFQSCDKFEWNFDDGTSLVTTKAAPHQFAGTKGIYHVTLRVYNEAGSATVSYDMNFGVPLDPQPILNFEIAPTTGSINSNITFKANSNLATTTNWTWTFGDGAGDPQGGTVASSSTTTHKYTQPGPYLVTVKAKNGTSPEAQLTHTITINATPQVKYLLPVVTHAKGAGSSVWRTDLQIFRNSGGSATPLNFKVEFISNKQQYQPKTLTVTQSTYIYEDFVSFFTSGDDSGSMVLTLDTNVLPQIWTRIYNVSEGGTFGQYIPAILLSDGTSATTTSPISDGLTNFYLPGLRISSRFRTNVGFVNVTPAALTLTVKAYDSDGFLIGTFSRTIFPFQLDQFNIASQLPAPPPEKPFSLQIVSPTGTGLLAYASILDNFSNDPAYLPAIPEDDVKDADFRNIVVPGVGHLASGWRTDVSIYNPGSIMRFNLTYFNQAGASIASAQNVVLRSNETLQLDDLLRDVHLQPPPPDGFGMLRVDTDLASEGFPTVASRTYFDKGDAGSYGQGIGGVALNRANVKPGKPGFIPAVRSDDNYYTNIGLVNLSNQATKVRVTLLQRDTGVAVNAIDFDLAPNQTIIRSPTAGADLLRALDPSADRGSFKIEIVSGGNVWAFASMINGSKSGDPNVGSKDPEYVAAIPTP